MRHTFTCPGSSAVALLIATACAAAWVCPTAAAEDGRYTVRGTLQPEGGNPADWQIVASPRLHAELPRGAGGQPSAIAPKANGTFALKGLGRGWTYVCAYAGGKLDVESVVPVQLPPEEGAGQMIALKPKPPRAKLEVALRNDDGEPVGRQVKAHLYNVHGEVTGSTGGISSDGAGVLRFENLPAAQYDLWLEADDALPAALFRNLEVTSGADAQRLELPVPKPRTVKGRLLLADGKTPAKDYVVAIQTGTVPEEGTPAGRRLTAYARGALTCYAECTVADDGSFALAGLTPGQHLLDIRRPGEAQAWSTLKPVRVEYGRETDMGTVYVPEVGWQYMFDRKSLDGWMESDFWGKTNVRIENDRVVMDMGHDMTGITWTKELPRIDYEVTLQAMRVAGEDFFCGLTFPVKKDPLTLILGGWGGGVVGLSSLDGFDASENETSSWRKFDNQRWYRIRLRVTAAKVEAWVDHEQMVDAEIADRQIGVRLECEPSVPFGIATWCTTGAARDIRLRPLNAPGG